MLNEITMCEVCGAHDLVSVLDMSSHPMCDDIVPIDDPRICKEYPIEILFCNRCKTAHQRYQVPKHELFSRSYHYRSRFTADVLTGMSELVNDCEASFGDLSGKVVLDVGCNDGSLLGFFREKGASTIGIEPTGAAEDAMRSGHKVYMDYLVPESAERIVKEHGIPDLITFTNVFAHIENLEELILSLSVLHGDNTMIVIENHYLGAVFERNQFDTFYHEHPRTYSLTSFMFIAKNLGMKVLDVVFPSRYGGNIRVFLSRDQGKGLITPDRLKVALGKETDFLRSFALLRKNIARWHKNKGSQIAALVRQYGPLKAKAFPGRAAILVKMLDLDETHISAVYEKPGSLKIGHYVPGTRIPILSDEHLIQENDDSSPILNLAWHISDEIKRYMSSRQFNGDIVDILDQADFTDSTVY